MRTPRLPPLVALFALAAAATPAPSAGAEACLGRAAAAMLRAGQSPLPVLRLGPRDFKNGTYLIPRRLRTRLDIRAIRTGNELGHGTGGTVHQAVAVSANGRSKQDWALKISKQGYVVDEREGMLLQHAAAQGARHIVPPRARVVVVDKNDVVQQEAHLLELTGTDLHPLLKRGGGLSLWTDSSYPTLKADPAELSASLRGLERLASHLFKALTEVSRAGIVHRDIKPANIVIFGGKANTLAEVMKGTARFGLIDFGLATPRGWTHPDWELVGTVGAIPPESYRSKPPPPDLATDLYSVGVVLARGLAGADTSKYTGPLFKTTSVNGEVVVAHLKPELVKSELEKLQLRLEGLGVPEAERKAFDRLMAITLATLDPDPVARVRRLTELATPDETGVAH